MKEKCQEKRTQKPFEIRQFEPRTREPHCIASQCEMNTLLSMHGSISGNKRALTSQSLFKSGHSQPNCYSRMFSQRCCAKCPIARGAQNTGAAKEITVHSSLFLPQLSAWPLETSTRGNTDSTSKSPNHKLIHLKVIL